MCELKGLKKLGTVVWKNGSFSINAFMLQIIKRIDRETNIYIIKYFMKRL